MISLSKLKSDELFHAYAGIAFIMLIVPISLTKGLHLPVFVLILCYIFYMILNRKQGVSFLLVALGLTYCSGSMGDAMNFSRNAYLKLFLLATVLLTFLCFYVLRKKRSGLNAPSFFIILYIILSVFYQNDITKTLLMIAGTHIAFCIGRYDGITPNQAFELFFFCVFFTFFYTVLEYHFGICPYRFIYESTSTFGLGGIHRAQGLLGNPLLLCSVSMLFLTCIFWNALEKGHINKLYLVICLYLALIVTSRTSIYTASILFVFYLFYSKNFFSFKNLVITLVTIGLFYFTVQYYFGDILINLEERFETGNYAHRESALSTTLNVLKDHPLGLGNQLAVQIQHYATDGFKDGMTTLDNFLCTQFSVYGYLGILLILFYWYYNYRMIFKWNNKKYQQAGALLVLYFLLIGMSFDLEAYINLNLPYYIIISSFFNKNSIKHNIKIRTTYEKNNI